MTGGRSNPWAALGAPGSIVIDAIILVAYLDGGDPFGHAAAVLLDELVAPGIHPAVISAVTVTECLVRPFRAGPDAVRLASTFLAHFPNLRIRPVDADVATEAARIRASTGLRAPDALVLATATVEGIDTVVTADEGWRRAAASLGGVRVVVPAA